MIVYVLECHAENHDREDGSTLGVYLSEKGARTALVEHAENSGLDHGELQIIRFRLEP